MNSITIKHVFILTVLSGITIAILNYFVNVQPKNSEDITNEFQMLIADSGKAPQIIKELVDDSLKEKESGIAFDPIKTNGFYDTNETIILKANLQLEPKVINLIEIPDTHLAYINFWTIAGGSVKHKQSGMRVAVSKREIFDNSNIITLPARDEKVSIIISIKTDGPLELKLLKWTRNNWLENQSIEKTLYGIFFGVILILIVYNILHAFYLKTYSYYFYCLYLLAQVTIVITNSGLTKLFFWSDKGFFDTQIMYIAMAASTWFGLGFCISFLKVKQLSKYYYYLGTVLIIATIIISILNFLGVYPALMMQIYYGINFICLIYYFIVPLYIVKQGREYAKYLFYGFGIFSVTLAYTIFKTIGFIENNAPTQEILSVGILIESLFLSIALYERIRNIKAKQEIAENKLRIASANFEKALLANQEKDRTEISAFLHDAIGHDALILKQKVNSHDYDKKIIIKHVDNLIDKIRNLSTHIHPHVLSNLGLTSAIKQLMKNALINSELEYSMDLYINENKLSNNISISIYRIFQESLNNTLKYANASEVFVRLIDKGDYIYGEIKDDGDGVKDINIINSGSGLTIMKGRVKLLGGMLTVESELNHGTKISFTVPYKINGEPL